MTAYILVSGFYNDSHEAFQYLAVIGNEFDRDGNLAEDDDRIFYYFESKEAVIGKHEEFTIVSFNYI